ncbi:zf-CCHC domain-containing protein [Tanacetum coccineum]
MQRPPLLEPKGFCFWKARFETYVKSKDIDLWQVIQNNYFYFEVEDSKTKMMKETLYELLKYEKKKQLGKNNEAKMNLYNALPHKEYEQVFMCKTTKENFSICNEELDSGFTRFNTIITSLKSLDLDYSSKNHVMKFLHALQLKWRAKVTTIKETKDLATLPLDELISNLKVYETILRIDGVASKPIKEKVMSIFLKANVTRGQTSSNSGKKHDKFGICKEKTKGGESSICERGCYNCGNKNHFIGDCLKSKRNKEFIEGAWSDNEDGNEPQNDATCLMDFDSQEVLYKPFSSNNDLDIIDLQKENEELSKLMFGRCGLHKKSYKSIGSVPNRCSVV